MLKCRQISGQIGAVCERGRDLIGLDEIIFIVTCQTTISAEQHLRYISRRQSGRNGEMKPILINLGRSPVG